MQQFFPASDVRLISMNLNIVVCFTAGDVKNGEDKCDIVHESD